MADDDATINQTIEAEHKEVTSAITALSKSGKPSEELFIEILDNLTIINTLKDELIYPIIETKDTAVAEQARANFRGVDVLLQELADLHPSDEAWMDDFNKLGEAVEAALAYEEASLLPILAGAVTPEESIELATTWDIRFDEEVLTLNDELEDEELVAEEDQE